MKKVVSSKDCFSCRDCCYFYKNQRYFAPLFTEDELRKIKKLKKQMPKFKRYKNHAHTYQVVLKKVRNKKLMYVCPFLDEKTHICTVYSARPFDCRTWPLMVMRKKNRVYVAYFNQDFCPALKDLNEKEFRDYISYMVKLVTGKRYINFLTKHPNLIWDYEKDVIPVKEITKLSAKVL
jgi:Fe-S-cluster containining protein